MMQTASQQTQKEPGNGLRFRARIAF